MRVKVLAFVGVLILVISLVLSSALAIPEIRNFRECRELSLRAFEGSLIYQSSYTLPPGLINMTLDIVSSKETTLNVTYGLSHTEPNSVVAKSTFTFFIGNATHFYVHVTPHENTNLSICLSALSIQHRSYLLLPTLVSWICGTIMVTYAALTRIEQAFRKGVKSKT